VKIIEYLDQAERPLISFEIIPPARGRSANEIYEIVDELIEFEPPFIDVTSHAADAYYIEKGEGVYERHIKRKRPGTIGLCAALKYRYKVEAVPHLLCRGFNRQETEDALIELNYLGIENVLAIRGDDTNFKKSLQPGRKINEHSIDLVRQIAAMNRGRYEEEILDASETDFCIGVGAHPEKHPDAPSLEADIRYLRQKVEAGAHYIVTQMFFKNSDYFSFVEACRAQGIEVPIIPGIKLLTREHQLHSLPKHFSVNIPDNLVTDFQEAKSKQDRVQLGIDYAVTQTEELLNANVPCIHFYVMADARQVKEVMKRLGT